jgi:hypothetical protein
MKCRQAQDLMYLYRPGELTVVRRTELEEHLASCSACSAESKSALQAEKKVSAVRNVEPRIEDAARLTRAIMKATAESRQQPLGLFRVLSEWTATPIFRMAACFALFVISATFFLQTALDARKVAILEGRLKSVNSTPGSRGLRNIQRAGLILPGPGGIPTLPESLNIAVADIGQWQQEPALDAILQTLLGRRGQNGTGMIDYLVKKHPRLASVRIDDGFDDREREILAADGAAFIKEMELLIQKGGIYHGR